MVANSGANKRHGHDDEELTPEDDDDKRQTRADDYTNAEMRKKCIIDAYTKFRTSATTTV